MTEVEKIVLRNILKQLEITENRVYGMPTDIGKINRETELYPIASEIRSVTSDIKCLIKES